MSRCSADRSKRYTARPFVLLACPKCGKLVAHDDSHHCAMTHKMIEQRDRIRIAHRNRKGTNP